MFPAHAERICAGQPKTVRRRELSLPLRIRGKRAGGLQILDHGT